MRGVVIAGTALVVALAGGCTRVNPAYCDPNVYGSCAAGFHCDAARNVCVSSGEPRDAGHEAGGDARPGDGGADVGPECSQSSDCADPDKPICDGSSCVACGGDPACAARDAATPACVSGRCVECATYAHCPTARPLCGAANTCAPCQRDAECRDGPQPGVGVCAAGACPAAADVLWVDGDAASCGAADGSEASPYCQPAAALAQAMSDARKTVVIKPNASAYTHFIVKHPALAGVIVVGFDDGVGGVATIQGVSGVPAVDIDLSGAVTLRRLHLKGVLDATTAVLQCASAACTAEELEIYEGGIGVRATTAAPLRLARCRVHDNKAGGVSTQMQADYVIENNFIYSNGTLSSFFGGVAFSQSYELKTFVNNTVWGNLAKTGAVAGVSCDAADILVANNILWENRAAGALAEVNATCAVTFSLIDDPAIAAVGNNVGGAPAFENVLVSPYDVHITDGSSARGGASPAVAPGDDIDGEPRPAEGPTDMGADQWY